MSNRFVRFQHVKPHGVALRVVKDECKKIKGHDIPESGSQCLKERRQIATQNNRL